MARAVRIGVGIGAVLLLVRMALALGLSLAVTGPLALGVLLVSLRRPRTGSLVVVALAPLLPRLPGLLGDAPYSPPEILVLAFIAGWGLAPARPLHRDKMRPGLAYRLARLGLVGLIGVAGLSALVALATMTPPGSRVFWNRLAEFGSEPLLWRPDDPMHPLRVWVLMAEGALFFLLVGRWTMESRYRERLLDAFLVGIVGVALATVAALATGRGLGTEGFALTLSDANSLASYLVMGIWVALGAAFAGGADRRIDARRVAAVLSLPLLLVALVLSSSRVAWLALLATLVLLGGWAALRGRLDMTVAGAGRRIGLIVGILIVTLLILIGVMAATGSGQFYAEQVIDLLPVRDSTEHLLRGRLEMWSAAVGMAVDHPLLGVGLGAYPRLLPAYADRQTLLAWGPTMVVENAHGYFFQTLAETGALGLVTLLGVLAALGLAVVRLGRASSLHGVLGLAITTGAIAHVLTWLTGHPLLLPEQQILFWAAAAFLVGVSDAAVADPDEPFVPDPRAEPATRAEDESAAHPPRRAGSVPVPASGQALAWARPATLGLLLLAALVAGVRLLLVPAPAGASATWGVYAWEEAGGVTARWTGPRALMALAPRGRVPGIRLLNARPDDRTVYATLRVDGDLLDEIRLPRDVWVERWYPTLGGRQGVVDLEVAPGETFVPAAVSGSADERELGVMLAAVQWSQRMPVTESGLHEWESEADGRAFRWMGARASWWARAAESPLTVEVRASHPDLGERPVRVLAHWDGEPVLERMLSSGAWEALELPLPAGRAGVLTLAVDRVWIPRRMGAGDDPRVLGLAVAGQVQGRDGPGILPGALPEPKPESLVPEDPVVPAPEPSDSR